MIVPEFRSTKMYCPSPLILFPPIEPSGVESRQDTAHFRLGDFLNCPCQPIPSMHMRLPITSIAGLGRALVERSRSVTFVRLPISHEKKPINHAPVRDTDTPLICGC